MAIDLADVARVRLVETARPVFTVGNFKQGGTFYVVQIDDRRGASINVERLVTHWTIWGTRLKEQGAPVRTILQAMLPRLPPDAEIDPRVRTYAATGALS